MTDVEKALATMFERAATAASGALAAAVPEGAVPPDLAVKIVLVAGMTGTIVTAAAHGLDLNDPPSERDVREAFNSALDEAKRVLREAKAEGAWE